MKSFIMIKTIIVTCLEKRSSLLLPSSLRPPHHTGLPAILGTLQTPLCLGSCVLNIPLLFPQHQHGSFHHLLSSIVTFPERPTIHRAIYNCHSPITQSPVPLSHSTCPHILHNARFMSCFHFSPHPRVQALQRQGFGSVLVTEDPQHLQQSLLHNVGSTEI